MTGPAGIKHLGPREKTIGRTVGIPHPAESTPLVSDIKLMKKGTMGIEGNVEVCGDLTMLNGKKLCLQGSNTGEDINDLMGTIKDLQAQVIDLQTQIDNIYAKNSILKK